MSSYTNPVTIHRVGTFSGAGQQQGREYGSVAVALEVAKRMKAADPVKTVWYVAMRRDDMTYRIEHV